MVQEKEESRLKKLLATAENTISELKSKLASAMQELHELKSIRGRLNTATLEQENQVLRGEVKQYRSILEEHGLLHLFVRGRERQKNKENMTIGR